MRRGCYTPLVVIMNEQEQDWYLDLKDKIDEAKREQEQKQESDYLFCTPDLLEYSLRGIESISNYE